MSDVVIRAEGISKQYRLGPREPYKVLVSVLPELFNASVRRVRGLRSPAAQQRAARRRAATFWALDDVSFAVNEGEVVGIIGRNGSGKSTLLKILSRITEPTKGYAEIRGRVGSLLEVGTGFHPELSGRDNISLNGAILGMRRKDISRRFDEIVAFAEVEKFVDTPVKYYSSGMYMRLAFAVAAHLEPEILLVDEVLAVGDAEFQKKCLGKMGDVAKQGRTVLFVSHNMLAMQDLCQRVVWLQHGKVVAQGASSAVIGQYMQTSLRTDTEKVWPDRATAPGNDQVRLHRARVRPTVGDPADAITVRTPFAVEFEYWNQQPGAALKVYLQLFNEQGIMVFEASPAEDLTRHPLPAGLCRDVCYVPGDLLNNGLYWIVLAVGNTRGQELHREDDVLVFEIQDATDMREGWYGTWGGVVRPRLQWQREHVADDVPRM